MKVLIAINELFNNNVLFFITSYFDNKLLFQVIVSPGIDYSHDTILWSHLSALKMKLDKYNCSLYKMNLSFMKSDS